MPIMPLDATDRDILRAALADPEASWSLGAFGAAAEFRRRPDETFAALGDGRMGLRTGRGGIALTLSDLLRPVAYEMPVGDGWSHAVALCLPAAALDAVPCTRFTELGPDIGALDPARRAAVSFDLGLGLAQVSVRIRTDEPGACGRLRTQVGTVALDFDAAIWPDVAARHADLVLVGPLGRIEVQGGGLGDPFGPRAYVVPKVLRLRRTHVATAPIPPGLVPVAHLYPPHPCRDQASRPIPFDSARHDAFQALLARWGDLNGSARKAKVAEAGPVPADAANRWSRAAERVARAQAPHIAGLRRTRAVDTTS